MEYNYAMEKHDYSRIDKLNKLTNLETFWDDVRKMTKNITSDHSIKRYQILAENRYRESREQNGQVVFDNDILSW